MFLGRKWGKRLIGVFVFYMGNVFWVIRVVVRLICWFFEVVYLFFFLWLIVIIILR